MSSNETMSRENYQWGSVAVIANTGFGFLLFMNGFIYTGILTLTSDFVVLVFSLVFLIGIGYAIAGLIELRRGQETTGWVIIAYSLFGFIIGGVYLFSYGIPLLPIPSPTAFLVFWIFWIFVSIVSGVILKPLGKMIAINLFWLAVTFALFAAAGYGNPVVALVAGIFAFAQSFYNWYLVAALMINTTYKKMYLPLK
jgi:succinate-acetate transporter protein